MDPKFSLLISTMNERVLALSELPEINGVKYIIVHQQSDGFIIDSTVADLVKVFNDRLDISYFSMYELGLSKSRNFALRVCDTEFACIMDDDVVIMDVGFVEKLEQAFIRTQADMICTRVITDDNKYFKKYIYDGHRYNIFTCAKISSIEMCVNVKSLRKLNLQFDCNFGLGSHYPSGEEYIFTSSCLKSGLKISHLNYYFLYHPIESSGMDFYSSDKLILTKFKMFEKVFPYAYFFVYTIFILRKSKTLITNRKFFSSFLMIFK